MTGQHTDQAPALTAQYGTLRACELVRERIAEADALEHVPTHILADLDQILSEVLDLPQPPTSMAAVDLYELRRTATEYRKRYDDVAAEALLDAASEIEHLRRLTER